MAIFRVDVNLPVMKSDNILYIYTFYKKCDPQVSKPLKFIHRVANVKGYFNIILEVTPEFRVRISYIVTVLQGI